MNIEYKRTCSGCNKEIIYNGPYAKYAYKRAIKNNCKCKSCNSKGSNNPWYGKSADKALREKISKATIKGNIKAGIIKSTITTRNCPQCNKTIQHNGEWATSTVRRQKHRLCKSCANKGENNPTYGLPINLGRKHSEETCIKISKAQTGKKLSEETKKNIRIAALKRLDKLGIPSCIDKGATEWFNKLNSFGYNFKPTRFLEIGYDADGYDKEKHIWYEFDTPYHRTPRQIKKDLIRQNNIINHFKSINKPLSRFIRAHADDNGEVLFETFINN